MAKSGLKMAAEPKSAGQKTLEEAFDAGKMYREAKEIQKKTGGKRRFMVSYLVCFRTSN